MNGLMIAFAFRLPYHLMRAATAAGVAVNVLGNGASRGLRASRYCLAYRESRLRSDGDADLLLGEICEFVRRRPIDIIFPSDDVSTRLIASLRDRLPAPTIPLPDVATFDLLNNKWNFTRFCRAHGVKAPEARLFDDIASLQNAIANGQLRLPLTVKPINRSGGFGVVHLHCAEHLANLGSIDYRPLLVQRHILGEWHAIPVFCRKGEVLAYAVQRRDEARFQLIANKALLEGIERVVAATAYNGPINFDAVVEEESGLAYFVECNPRFWYTIHMSMLAGLNFAEIAFASGNRSGGTAVTRTSGIMDINFPAALRRPWRVGPLGWKMARYAIADPIPGLLRRLKLFDDRHVAVAGERMTVPARIDRVLSPPQTAD